MTIKIGTLNGNKNFASGYVGVSGANKGIVKVMVGSTSGNKIVWEGTTIPVDPPENVLTSEEIIGERTPIKIEDGFYIMDIGSYAGVRFNWMNLEVGTYKVTIECQGIDNAGRLVVLKGGTGSPISGTNISFDINPNTPETVTTSKNFNCTEAGQYSLIIVRNSSSGIFKLKVDSITVTAV